MSDLTENVNKNAVDEQQHKPAVSWFLRREALFKNEGKNGEFYKARVFPGTRLPDGKDISGYTYNFNVDKLKEIRAYDSSPDFIKDPDFRDKNGVVYYNEDTKIKLTEPYDKTNPNKELETIVVDAKTLCTAQRNRERPSKEESSQVKSHVKGTKDRITDRAVKASQSKSSTKNEHVVEQGINK